MGNPTQKQRRLDRIRSTEKIVKRRKTIITDIWHEDPAVCFPNSPEGRLKKYNLVCGCPTCRAGRERYNGKGSGKRMHNLLKRGFNL